jgi:hypothetical protein
VPGTVLEATDESERAAVVDREEFADPPAGTDADAERTPGEY